MDIFKALSDPARRALLEALRVENGQTLSALSARFEMSRFGVMKHLGLLEEAGLITTVKRGRFKHHYLKAESIQQGLAPWLEPFSDASREVDGQLASAAPPATLFVAAPVSALRDALQDMSTLRLCLGALPLTDLAPREDGLDFTMADGTNLASLRLIPEGAHTAVTLAQTAPDPATELLLARFLSALKTRVETGRAPDFTPPG